MTARLVADVGGTNTRIGSARGGAVAHATVRTYRNDEFDDFAELVQTYLNEAREPEPDMLVAAVAGPVADGRARLTNRDWLFDAAALANRFSVKVALLNDLAALGHALPHLDGGQYTAVVRPAAAREPTGQSLVVGVGTGFNVSPVLSTASGHFCLRAEYGHTHMPVSVRERLRDAVGPKAEIFKSVEDLFSGRGYQASKALFQEAGAAVGSPEGTGQLDPSRFERVYAELLGLLTADLMLAFLPMDGVFFAGGVARNLLTSDAGSSFARSFESGSARKFDLSAPVNVIIDDAAALKGCANFGS